MFDLIIIHKFLFTHQNPVYSNLCNFCKSAAPVRVRVPMVHKKREFCWYEIWKFYILFVLW